MNNKEQALQHYINNAKREIIFKLTHGDRSNLDLTVIANKIKYKNANIDMYDDFLDWLNKIKVEYDYGTGKTVSLGVSIPKDLKKAVVEYKDKKGLTMSGYITKLIQSDLQRVGAL
jgi:hypothetical protein